MSQFLSDFLHKNIKPRVRGPQVDGRTNIKPENLEQIYSLVNDNDDSTSSDDDEYAEEFIQKEMNKYYECMKSEQELNDQAQGTRLDTLCEMSTELDYSEINSGVHKLLANNQEIYEKYNFDATLPDKNLTIHSYKGLILEVIRTNPVVIIDGPTGCGKTTQVPQYILDQCRAEKKFCNIVVTQPRKIATINVAKRVCQERGWTIGSVCGYQIGLQKEVGPDVILTYMTTGVLLQKLIASKNLNEYTHIVVDEVHERNQELDFLLLVIRKLLFTKCYQTKVILMSATIDAEEFAQYFRTQCKDKEVMAPIVQIKKPNPFQVTTFYTDSLQPTSIQKLHFDQHKPEISEEVKKAFLFLLTIFDKFDEKSLPNERRFGSVLVFLPGIQEIEELQNMLVTTEERINPGGTPLKWFIIPLHSSLPNDEQAKAFQTVALPTRKIILSTNLAESSITVPDISYVIDFCLTKNLVVDKVTKFSSLQLEWASHSNCEQRAGRVGRVSNGRVYRMVTQEFYENCLPRKTTPEIIRAPLEQVVLHAKKLELNEEPKAILALSLNPPNLINIETTIWHLKEIGALLQTCNGIKNASDGDMTFLGTIMSSLPLEVCLSKLIALGHLYSVLYDAIVMAAGCSIHNIFSTPFKERYQSYNKKLLWADGSCSDLIALLNLFKVWTASKRNGVFRNQHAEYLWCKENLVNLRGLREWQILVSEIQSRLKRLGIEETSGAECVKLTDSEKTIILKVIICGAFYPNYFIRSTTHCQIDEMEAVKKVGGRDPYKTVYLTGITPGQPSGLYSKEIKRILDLNDDALIETDESSKIYVEFKNFLETDTVCVDGQQFVTTIPGKIATPVYQMVKKRMLKIPLMLDILPKSLAWDQFRLLEKKNKTKEKFEMEGYNCFSQPVYDPFPSLDTEYITLTISYRIDAGHFYCQNTEDYTQNLLDEINRIINSTPLNPANPKKIKLRNTYAVEYKMDRQFYRAKIQTKLSEFEVQVIFIDYGNIQKVKLNELYELPDFNVMDTAPLALECYLSGVEPAFEQYRRGIWSEKVNMLFDSITQGTILYGKVFSVVDEIVHLELFRKSPGQIREDSLNQWLINNGHAKQTEESFLSKQDNQLRRFVLKSENPQGEAKKLSDAKKHKDHPIDVDGALRGVEEHIQRIYLKGPFSPLEMNLYNAMCHNEKSVTIEPSSVNSVLLDSDPLDPHTKLLVAASINQSPSGDKLVLRHTSMMPNLPGFPFLMAMLFCPEMEPKLTPDNTRVSSILCGLGVFENSKRPCYPAHDLLFTLDIELNEEIINSLNELRYAMNEALKELVNISCGNSRTSGLERFQRTVKNKLMQLMRSKFNRIDPYHIQNGHLWKNYSPELKRLTPPSGLDNDVWPLHWFFQVRKMDEKPIKMWSNVEKMKMMSKRLIDFTEIGCTLCDKEFNTLDSLIKHLINPVHKKNEAELKIELNIT